jgi:methylglutaconyl-CoA hydratase
LHVEVSPHHATFIMSAWATHPGVRADARGASYFITLDAPERENRLTVAAMQAFIHALRAAHDADCLILRISGEGPDFCLGRVQGEKVEGLSVHDSLSLILEANALLRNFPGVSLAHVQGRAFGFGAGIALQCDLTLAADNARFAFDEIEHGLAPLVVAEYLPRFVGFKRAHELVLTGRVLEAGTAEAWGMVNNVAPRSELEHVVELLVGQLERYEPGALRLMKRYGLSLRSGEHERPEEEAVARLAEWLAAGRPEHPAG